MVLEKNNSKLVKPKNMSDEEWNDYLSDMYDDFKSENPKEHEEHVK